MRKEVAELFADIPKAAAPEPVIVLPIFPKQAKRSKLYKRFSRDILPYSAKNRLIQQTVCEICGGKDKDRNLALDHCHKTGQVRGRLCMACNVALGHFKDNTDLLRKAVEYLDRYAEPVQQSA